MPQLSNINSLKFDIKKYVSGVQGKDFLFNYHLSYFHQQQISVVRATINI